MGRVLLIIGGGIAAYKSLELTRALQRRGHSVVPVLTAGAQAFITPLSAAALAGEKAYTDLFDLKDEAEMGHIALSRSADIVVVAPATANLIGRMANGLADDLATTLLLATDKQVMIAPAMNVRMWQHPATQRNIARLISDGVVLVGPDEGDMACGEHGPGRLAEPEVIAAAVDARLGQRQLLKGLRAVVTSGPTIEPIDPVRFIANRSSGRQGHAMAEALARAGADVTLVSGPVTLADPEGVAVVRVERAIDMLRAVEQALPADIAIFAAAVADWRVEEAGQKLKKSREGLPTLALAENPDIASTIAHGPLRPRLVIGFAAETENLLPSASEKRVRKGLDWIIANDVSASNAIFGGAENEVNLITPQGVEAWPRMGKQHVARQLVARIAAHMGREE